MRIANHIEESTGIKSPHATQMLHSKEEEEEKTHEQIGRDTKQSNGLQKWNLVPEIILCFLFRRIQIRRWPEQIYKKRA